MNSDIKANIELIISTEFEDIISSDKVLILMKTYSVLFLNGGVTPSCSKCLRGFYEKIKFEGLKKLKKMGDLKTTCKCNNKGLKYVPEMGHYNLEQLTDRQAIQLLEKGWLNEADFSILPKDYEANDESDEIENVLVEHHKTRKRKTK